MIYILDTNAISDYLKHFEPTTNRMKQAIRAKHILYLCPPVEYEVLRGLIRAHAEQQRRIFEDLFAPQLGLLAVTDSDWRQAAQLWAEARSAGKQLSDIDLLVAALARRTNAIIVSSDDDFDVLPVRRENWRVISQTSEPL